MRNITFILVACLIIPSANAVAKNLQQIGLETIEKSLAEQIQFEGHKYYLKGEFPTRIQSTLVPTLLGIGKMIGKDQEATGFTTASVLNVLGEIYLHHPELRDQQVFAKIPQTFAMAVATFGRYEAHGSFNFYPERVIEGGVVVRRPIDMTLFPIWHGFTNIPNDSDSSSAILMSKALYAKITGAQIEIQTEALNQISQYRDVNRHPMFYNRLEKRKRTGAFMTWLFDEHDPAMPKFWFAASKRGTRIPFNKNDVDCVVNANILKLIATLDQQIPGVPESCDMLNSMIEKDESDTCGIYYPNTYNLSFSLGSAKAFGNRCISQANEQLMVSRIVSQRQEDGSWTNIGNIWKDETLSTAFALHAILTLDSSPSSETRWAVYHGLQYLLRSAKFKSGSYEWKEDNFFTATAIARSLIMWRSKAYTHAIIASVFLRAAKLFPELTDQELLDDHQDTPKL